MSVTIVTKDSSDSHRIGSRPAEQQQKSVIWQTSSEEEEDNESYDEEEDEDDQTLYEPRTPAQRVSFNFDSLGLVDSDDSHPRQPVHLDDRISIASIAPESVSTKSIRQQHTETLLQQFDERIKRTLDLVDRKCNRYICCCVLLLLLAGCIAAIIVFASK